MSHKINIIVTVSIRLKQSCKGHWNSYKLNICYNTTLQHKKCATPKIYAHLKKRVITFTSSVGPLKNKNLASVFLSVICRN